MVSFDAVSLFTKTPARLAVEIAKSRLEALDNSEEITSWSMEKICKGLQILLNAANLTFEENIANKFLLRQWARPFPL